MWSGLVAGVELFGAVWEMRELCGSVCMVTAAVP